MLVRNRSQVTGGGGGVVSAPWAESGSALAFVVLTPGSDPARHIRAFVNLGGALTHLNGQRATVAYRLHSTQPFTMEAPHLTEKSGTTAVTHAASGSQTVPANTPVTVYATFTAAAAPDSDIKVDAFIYVGGLVEGQRVDISSIEVYAGDFDASRDFIYKYKPGTESTRYVSVGNGSPIAPDGSFMKQVRRLTLPQPTQVTIPSGINWDDVANDLAEVARSQ